MNRSEAAEFLRRRRDQECNRAPQTGRRRPIKWCCRVFMHFTKPDGVVCKLRVCREQPCAMIPFAGQSRINILRDPIMFGPAMFGAALGPFVCAAIILVCPIAVVHAQEPSRSDNYTALMLQICRQYANATAQTGRPADLMFQQCAAERHCRISLRTAGYQCEPPGPMIIRPGA